MVMVGESLYFVFLFQWLHGQNLPSILQQIERQGHQYLQIQLWASVCFAWWNEDWYGAKIGELGEKGK